MATPLSEQALSEVDSEDEYIERYLGNNSAFCEYDESIRLDAEINQTSVTYVCGTLREDYPLPVTGWSNIEQVAQETLSGSSLISTYFGKRNDGRPVHTVTNHDHSDFRLFRVATV